MTMFSCVNYLSRNNDNCSRLIWVKDTVKMVENINVNKKIKYTNYKFIFNKKLLNDLQRCTWICRLFPNIAEISIRYSHREFINTMLEKNFSINLPAKGAPILKNASKRISKLPFYWKHLKLNNKNTLKIKSTVTWKLLKQWQTADSRRQAKWGIRDH